MAYVDSCRSSEEATQRAKAARDWRKQMFAPPQKVEPPKPVSVPSITPELAGLIQAAYPLSYPLKIYAPRPSIVAIQRAVCDAFNVTYNELLSARRTANLVMARQVCFGISRIVTRRSFPEIGRMFGGKDHSTILHGCRRIEPVISLAKERVGDSADPVEWAKAAFLASQEIPKLHYVKNGQHSRK